MQDEIKSGFVETITDQAIKLKASEIKLDAYRRTIDDRQEELQAARAALAAAGQEVLAQRHMFEDEIAHQMTIMHDADIKSEQLALSIKQMDQKMEAAASAVETTENQLDDQVRVVTGKIHYSTTSKQKAELHFEQQNRALQSREAKLDALRAQLEQMKVQKFTIRDEVREQMSGKVLEESMRAQEAHMNHQGLERTLQSLRTELQQTQDEIETTKTQVHQRRRGLRDELRSVPLSFHTSTSTACAVLFSTKLRTFAVKPRLLQKRLSASRRWCASQHKLPRAKSEN